MRAGPEGETPPDFFMATNKSKKKTTLKTTKLGRLGQVLNLSQKIVTKEIGHLIKNAVSSEKQDSIALRIEQATELVKTLGALKGAAMKMGQILAIEARDLLPDEVVKVLEKLQSQAAPIDYEIVEKTLKKELGTKFSKLKNISEEPIAIASIGQVHRATYLDQEIVLKVQHPGVDKSVDSDVALLGKMLKTFSNFSGRGETDFAPFLKEVKKMFLQETDYLKEAEYTEIFAKNYSDNSAIVIPKVFHEITTSRVLALSYEEGVSLSEAIRSGELTRKQKDFYTKTFIDLVTREFCEFGLVQTDPNLGNFLLRPKQQELVLLDFGATKSFSKEFRKQYSKLIMASFHEDHKEILKQSIKMGLISENETEKGKQSFTEFMIETMSPFRSKLYDFADETYGNNIRDMSRKMVMEFKVTAPPRDIIFLNRKLNGIFQIARRFESKMDLKSYISFYEELAKS